MTLLNPAAVPGHNTPPADVLTTIQDLYDTAKDFADGEAIADEAMHDTISSLYDQIHEAGKAADAARKEEKKPHDDAIDAIQARYNPYIQPKKGMVDRAKAALGDLLAAWRKRVADEKARIAAEAKAEADRLAAAAREAMAASAGNLAALEEAEVLVKEAAAVERFAKAATKGPTGLRTVWVATLEDEAAALDWCYQRAPDEFRALCQSHADAVVRAGMRSVPGFKITETKVV